MTSQVLTGLVQLAIVEGRVQAQRSLPNLAVGGNDDNEDAARRQINGLKVLEETHTRARVLDEGHLMRDLCEESNRALDDIINVDGLGQERLEGLALGTAHGLEFGEPVDEHAVAAVGRHTPGRRVRLVDEPGFLKHRHVVADRRRGDTEPPGGNRLGTDGLAGGHVLGDDGAQDVKAAVLCTRACHTVSLPAWHSCFLSANATPGPSREASVVRNDSCALREPSRGAGTITSQGDPHCAQGTVTKSMSSSTLPSNAGSRSR